MLIVLLIHPFIMFPALFLISNASMHLRSSSLFMLDVGFSKLWLACHLCSPVGFNVFVHGLHIHGQMFFNARANCPTSFTNINFITMQAFDFVYNVLIVATIWLFSRFASLAIIRATHCCFPWGKPL